MAKARGVVPELKSGHSFAREWLTIAADLYPGASVLQGSLRKINAHQMGASCPLSGTDARANPETQTWPSRQGRRTVPSLIARLLLKIRRCADHTAEAGTVAL